MPAALDGEGAFAASNSCIAVNGKEDVWFATGGSAARVFHSSDSGATWGVTETPIMHGAASEGIFSIAFRDPLHGVIAGGDYAHPTRVAQTWQQPQTAAKTGSWPHLRKQDSSPAFRTSRELRW